MNVHRYIDFSAAEKEYKSEEIQHDLEWHVTEVSGAQSEDPHPGGAEEKRPVFPLPGGGSSLLQRVSVGKWLHQKRNYSTAGYCDY